MILPILLYGNKVLRKKCEDISVNYPQLGEFIDAMWETMYNAQGCGLAAPQVDKPVRLFIVDSKSTYDSMDLEEKEEYFEKGDTGIRETFINASIIHRSDDLWEEEEGCLSIPNLPKEVFRSWTIEIEYFNKYFVKQRKTFSGSTARIIQHEYDHTDGILYVDHLKPLTKKLIEGKLMKITKGITSAKYPVK